ncbi:MAG: hypothetical protein K6G88_09425 [Lachnospiraceae bacterium]|nr:hypothetical protein [Lachnospiraceae bacterium]
MLKRIKIILPILLVMLLSGCGVNKYKVNNPLTEKEIIKYVQNVIYKEYGDETIVKIVNKEEEMVGTFWLDGWSNYKPVKGAYSYDVEIINKNNKELKATGTYEDGYAKYDKKYGKFVTPHSFTSDYKIQKGLFLIKKEFISALDDKFTKYYIYKDISDDEEYNIFINSSDYDEINDLLSEFNKTIIKYRDLAYTSYNVYIYKDESVFNETNFDLYEKWPRDYRDQERGDTIEKLAGKEVIIIGYDDSFNYDLFTSNGASAEGIDDEYVDYNTFEYLVFFCSAEPNSVDDNTSPDMYVLGVK